jgi:hypothetical protein
MVFGGAKKEVKQLGGGQFLTEFGICIPDTDRLQFQSARRQCCYKSGSGILQRIRNNFFIVVDPDLNPKLFAGSGYRSVT